MAIFKAIQSGSGVFQKTLNLLGQTSLVGPDLNFTKMDRTDLANRIFGNLFASFNLPITVQEQSDFTTGIYSNTAFQYLNQNTAIVLEIPKNTYGELIDGKSISLTIPVGSGSTNVYSSFFKNAILSHYIYSDPNQQSSEFGQTYQIQELPGQAGLATPLSGYSSNIAFLFSDSIQHPQNNSNLTWATNSQYFVNEPNLPTGVVGSKYPANYSSLDGIVDVPVGIAYLDKGFIVLTHPTIVNNFSYTSALNLDDSAYVGDANFTQIHFASGSTLQFQSFNTEFTQHVICIALPNEFYQSNNPTFTEAYGTNIANNPVAITEIGLYNSSMDLLAICKSAAPIGKNVSSILSFDITIKV